MNLANCDLRKILLVFVTSLFVTYAFAQHEPQKYYPVEDPLVQQKLEEWQDLKFGLLMHWGPYSQWGIVESWSICPEDYGWCQRKKEGTPGTYFEYVQAYEKLQTTFNPVHFDPKKWAVAAKDAGMKYVVFTTKHHDGFSMFDSKYTDYKITDPKTPFSSHPKSNIAAEIFNEFRNQDMWAGAYFSKPDWNSDDYWWPYFPPKDRNVNYDPEKYPERWERFTQFTHNQILELLTDYGKIDILWLDGGWVMKQNAELIDDFYHSRIDNHNGFINGGIVNQDIKMDDLVIKAREKQPGLIVVDRAVEGNNQNYLTPENRVPEKELPYPWESCIIAGGGWSYTPNAKYKSGHEVVHMLIDIVCKGGNLLLNIAPGPDGTWHDDAYKLLEKVGDWMKVNNEAIYNTRAIAPYKENNLCFTKKKDQNIIYAIYMADEGETQLPEFIPIHSFIPKKGSKITVLGDNASELKYRKNGKHYLIEVPERLQKSPPCKYAWTFKIEID